MRQLYQVLLLKPDQIAAEINKNHNLSVTSYQVRDKLNKLGYKKRLGPQQSEAIYRQVSKRTKIGKNSEVIIDGVITISGEKLQRALSRNISTTTLYRISKETDHQSTTFKLPGNIEVRTPKASTTDFVLLHTPTFRSIPLPILYNLPIWQLSRLLDKLHLRYPSVENTSNLKITAYQSIPHTPLLRLLIYNLSNNIPLRDPDELQILDRVNKFQLKEPLKFLLSNNSSPIRVVCETILPWLYLRQEFEIISFICGTHNLELDLYRTLWMLWDRLSYMNDELCRKLMGTTLRDIERTSVFPKSYEELITLFRVCRYIRKDVSIFQRMWDQNDFPDFIREYEWGYGFENPLATNNADELKSMLELGFTKDRWILVIGAILRDDYDLVKVFLEHSGLVSGGNKDTCKLTQSGSRDHEGKTRAWEKLDGRIFHRLIARFVGSQKFDKRVCLCWPVSPDILDWERQLDDIHQGATSERQSHDSDIEFHNNDINKKLVLVTCLNPEMVDYVGQVMCLANPSLTQPQVVSMAIDLLPIWHVYGAKRSCGCLDIKGYPKSLPSSAPSFEVSGPCALLGGWIKTFPPFALERLLQFSVDPSRTELWQKNIWEYLDRCSETFYGNVVGHFKVLLRCPDIISSSINLPVQSLSPESSKIFGSTNRVLAEPIEAAFFLRKPDAFCLLLESRAAISQYLLSTEPLSCYPDGFTFHGEFIEACDSMDFQRIHELWNYRIKALDANSMDYIADVQIRRSLKSKDFTAAAELSLQPQNGFLRIQVFLAIAKAGLGKEYGLAHTTLLRSILDAGVSLNYENIDTASPEFENNNKNYREILRDAIKNDNIELVEILLEYERQLNLREHLTAPNHRLPGYCPLRAKEVGYVLHAAQFSLRCLKRLIEHGFNIDGGICRCPQENISLDSRQTALQRAIDSGNMDTIVFVLQNGANLYAPFDYYYKSAVEYSIKKGRLDATALILSIEPNCYPLALRAAEETRYDYIATYVRNWKTVPANTTLLSGDGVSCTDTLEPLLVVSPT
ncbi:hypothetical protein TWF788_006626 [Orbilia oligospora]|uniref:Uncharacterized protein n=1 Tax=Orbilia oligospora TaxID=2813651 RepID=A0A7C8PVR1_ORBOL|nr:hypothetical protein TWF788_006626 [Orbilia oligospora]